MSSVVCAVKLRTKTASRCHTALPVRLPVEVKAITWPSSEMAGELERPLLWFGAAGTGVGVGTAGTVGVGTLTVGGRGVGRGVAVGNGVGVGGTAVAVGGTAVAVGVAGGKRCA